MMRQLPEGVDIAVVGAGLAGCSVAMPPLAAGLSVVLIEREQAADVGRKPCGNAVGPDGLAPAAHHVPLPKGAEIAARFEGGALYLPGGATGVSFHAPGVVLNRLIFGQRLLADAVSAGALLFDSCSCVGWSNRESNAIRVRFGDGTEGNVTARVVIDASGYRSVLTRQGGTTHDDPAARAEVAVGYREIVSLPDPIDERNGGFIVFAPPGAERGYAWVFPMGARLANVGIGTTLDTVDGSLKDAYNAFVAGHVELRGAECVSSGGGMVPVRRPRASLVGRGFMAVGDAACQTSPLHAGGIVPAIRAGVLAGEQAVRALSGGDVSADSLWRYAKEFMGTFGAAYAAHELLRDLLYSLSGSDRMFLWEQLASSEKLIEMAKHGGLLPGAWETLKRAAALATRPRLAAKIARAGRAMARVRHHYEDYPDSPGRLVSWVGHEEYLRRRHR